MKFLLWQSSLIYKQTKVCNAAVKGSWHISSGRGRVRGKGNSTFFAKIRFSKMCEHFKKLSLTLVSLSKTILE